MFRTEDICVGTLVLATISVIAGFVHSLPTVVKFAAAFL